MDIFSMDAQNVIASAGVVVAGIALILSSVSQIIAWSDRRLNRMPHIRIWLGTEQGGFVSFGVTNDGLGAAIIEEFSFTVDDKPVAFHMLFTELFGAGREFVSHRLAPPPSEIGLQSSVELFRIASREIADHQLMHEFARRVGVCIRARAVSLRDKRTEVSRKRIVQQE